MVCSKQPETVSIIIPVYHVEEYIEECIQSAILQTYPHIEIILVDDCGTDTSIAKAEKLLQASNRQWQTVRHQHNRGLSAARNTGVKIATGDYIYFLDSDDYIAPDCIQRLVDTIHLHQKDIAIGCGFVLLMPDKRLAPIWKDTAANLHTQDALGAYLRREHNFAACHRLINTEAYRSTGIQFREGLQHEDVIWSFQMARSGLSICSAPGNNLYFYRQREGSIMAQAKISPGRINGFIEATRVHYKAMMADGLQQNPDFCHMYAYLFHETVHMIMADTNRTLRARCRDVANYLREFSHCIPEIAPQYNMMKRFVALSRFMPAPIAFRIALCTIPKS